MKWVIRKVPERDTEYLERNIPNSIVINDTEHVGAIKSFIMALKEANDDAVYVQDDMLLCKDFCTKALEYIDRLSNQVIVFANFTHDKLCKVFDEGYHSPRSACWLLCTYIPKRIAERFISFMENEAETCGFIPNKFFQNDFDDAIFSRFLENIGEYVYVTVPNLAGHPKNKSVINPNRPKRICPNFDYKNAQE